MPSVTVSMCDELYHMLDDIISDANSKLTTSERVLSKPAMIRKLIQYEYDFRGLDCKSIVKENTDAAS